MCSMEFFEFWGRPRSGASFLRNIRRTRRATAASSSGSERACRSAFCACWLRSYKREENSSWRRHLSTPPSRGQKRRFAAKPTKRRKGAKTFVLADEHSLPVAVSIESASPHHFRRLVIRWGYHVKTSLAWSAWVACKSCLGFYERLLVPQRHYGVKLGRTAGGNEACQECYRGKDNHYRCIRNEISRTDLKQHMRHQA